MIYLSAAGVVLAAERPGRGRGGGLWPAALAIALAALWYSATPGPTVDGWYGLGWRTIFDPGAPLESRAALARGGARAGEVVVVRRLFAKRRSPRRTWDASAAEGIARLSGSPPSFWPRPAVRDPGRRAGRLLAALGDDLGAAGLRPGAR